MDTDKMDERQEGYEEYMVRRTKEEDEKDRLRKLHEMMDEDDRLAEEFYREKRMKEYKSILSDGTLDMLANDALRWHRDTLLDDIIDYEDKSRWLHDDDYANAHKLLVHFNAVCEYFGIDHGKGTLVRRVERGLDFKDVRQDWIDSKCPQCGMYEGNHKMSCTQPWKVGKDG